MSISGFLMYGSAQKNKFISFCSFALLSIYLSSTSSVDTLWFLVINLLTILIISTLLKRASNQIVSSLSILVYSIAIDTVCYFVFQLFDANVLFIAYVLAGLTFNFKSAIYVFMFAMVYQVIININNVSNKNTSLIAIGNNV